MRKAAHFFSAKRILSARDRLELNARAKKAFLAGIALAKKALLAGIFNLVCFN